MSRSVAAALAALVAAGCAGSSPRPRAPALCVLDRGNAVGEPDADTWIALLLRGVDRSTRRTTSPALDCTGAHVRWDGPALSCHDRALAQAALPVLPLTAGDVITTPVSPGTTLLWIATHRYASGDALGPVALVESAGTVLRVVAIGALRAFPFRARLRLGSLGGRQVLAAEGELCRDRDPASCSRAVRIVPLRGDRFAPEPLVGEDGTCVSPAWIDLARREQRRSNAGWERVDLGASMAFTEPALLLDEEVVIQELDRGPAGPGRVLRRAHATRTVRWKAQRLVVSGPSLWSLMGASHGRADP